MRTVYIISDLHLGGRFGADGSRGFRMMTRPEVLAGFIQGLAGRADAVELVINGDFLDFLAEEGIEAPGWTPFVADEAAVVARLTGMMAAEAPDGPVFDALAALLAAGHALTILLGNHDLELGLPAVRACFLDRLGPESARVRFIADGEAYLVGDSLIEHGNRYDGFNVVDQDAFRRLRSLLTRGYWPADAQALAGFEAPIGSTLVATIMNPIKAELGFVDLLKPEGPGLYALLLALRPSLLGKLKAVARLKRQADRRAPEGDLPPEPGMRDLGGRAADEEDGERAVWALLREAGFDGALVAEVQQAMNPPPEPGMRGLGDEPLTLGDRLKLKLIRAALRHDDLHAVWDPSVEASPGYTIAASALADRGFRYIVFGHTHIARDLPLVGGARYLNSGTWANLLGYPDGIELASDAGLASFVGDLEANRLAPYERFLPHAVELRVEGDRVVEARLLGPEAVMAPTVPPPA